MTRHLSAIMLDAATVLATVVAVAMVGHRLRTAPATGDASGAGSGGPVSVSDWSRYSVGGIHTRSSNPAVTIVVFQDYKCPACRTVYELLRTELDRYGRQLAIVYRYFPLSNSSFMAAVAAECASREGMFDQMSLALYAKAESLGTRPWQAYARDAGLADVKGFKACLDDPSALQAVWRDVHLGDSLYVRYTPTLLINELLYVGLPPGGLAQYLDSVMNQMSSQLSRIRKN